MPFYKRKNLQNLSFNDIVIKWGDELINQYNEFGEIRKDSFGLDNVWDTNPPPSKEIEWRKKDPARKIRNYVISKVNYKSEYGSVLLDPLNKEIDKYEEAVKNHLTKHEYILSPKPSENIWRISDKGKEMNFYGGHYKYQKILRKEKWIREHPFLVDLRKIIITAIATGCISILVGLFLYQQAHQSQSQIDKRQDSTLKALGDSLTNIQKHK